MNEETFDNTLREYVKRKPFLPFVVELVDGRRIVVERPEIAFGGGVAGFLSEEDGLVDFSCQEVSRFSFITAEATS